MATGYAYTQLYYLCLVIEVDGDIQSTIGNTVNIYHTGSSFGVRNI